MHTAELKCGPQDGGKVTTIGGGHLPHVVYVGDRPMGDGFVAWSREWCERKPNKYIFQAGQFEFAGRMSEAWKLDSQK